MEPFIGQIILFAGNFAPRGWALCEGQLLSIAQNSALFSVLGTTYGGDGQTTFGLPDLRGRVAVQQGHGPGLSSYALGERVGTESVTLTTAQIPSHTHALRGAEDAADQARPNGNALATADIYRNEAATEALRADSLSSTGGGQSHENRQPLLALNYIIALVGLYPSRE